MALVQTIWSFHWHVKLQRIVDNFQKIWLQNRLKDKQMNADICGGRERLCKKGEWLNEIHLSNMTGKQQAIWATECVCVCVCEREKKRETERERERERESKREWKTVCLHCSVVSLTAVLTEVYLYLFCLSNCHCSHIIFSWILIPSLIL